jgi:hypothetical protein
MQEKSYFSVATLCEREMALPGGMPLRPDLLWLNINLYPDYLAFITKYFVLSFTYPLRCLRLPPCVRVSQVEDTIVLKARNVFVFLNA